MDNQYFFSETTDDEAQGDGSSSSIHSDEDNSIQRRFLSSEDIDQCLYVTNINWRRRFSIRLSNGEKRISSNLIDQQHLRKIHSMSEINLIPMESSSSSSRTDDKSPSTNREKQISFEVKTNSYNRKVQVKTKQEDTICTTKIPSIVTRIITTETPPPLSPHRVSVIRGQRRSSISNSSIQNIRVSVTTSPNGRHSSKTAETEFHFPTTITDSNSSTDESYSTMISNFVSENLAKTSKFDDDSTFDHRPLLDLISQLNRRHTLNESPLPIESTSNEILPPKQLTPFRPMIIHKKQPEPIGPLEIVDSPSILLPRRNSRTSVVRSHTFNSPNVNQLKINSDEMKSTENVTCQSTPELSCSNERERDGNELLVNIDETAGLSTSGTILTSTSLTGLTPTASGTIDDKNEAKRKAIAMQMYDTEKSYVEALKNLVTKYYLPMKDKAVISNDLVNDIFYKIPEIHIHHTAFLISLSQKLSQWDNKQTVGDLLLQMFTRMSVIETYTSFVNNYKTAQIAIRLCRDSSSFNKFLEQQARDHRGKLTLRDLIIQPVQRIPRYELYIKDFLKCTNSNHPDYQLLLKAQSEIHSLAEQIDQVQKDVGSTEITVTNNSLEVVQDMIENLNDLVNANRYYIRHDVVTLQSTSGMKKDRCIFLFNDLVIITSCKRRTATLSKKPPISVIVNSPSGKQYIDNAKHKLIMRIPLESIDLSADLAKKRSTPPIIKKSHSTTNATPDKNRQLEEDVAILGQMTDLAKTINVPHQSLDESIKETLHVVNKHLTDEINPITRGRTVSPEPTTAMTTTTTDNNQLRSNNIQLIIHTTERTETIDVVFSSAEDRATWEKGFLEAKKALFEVAAERRNISFQHVLTLPHSRPGSQFSCGCPRLSLGDICICNSEGQVCLVNLQPTVALKACNTVISSRINCVAYVPSHKNRRTGSSSLKRRHQSTTQRQEEEQEQQEQQQAPAQEQENKEQLSSSIDVQTTPVDSLLDIDSSDDDETLTTIPNESISSFDQTSISSQSIPVENDLNNEQQDTREATMWLGTDDGIILIFQCTETMKTVARKSRIVKQLGSPIHSILYTDNKVFIALSHGELCVFRREMTGHWDLDHPILQSIEESSGRQSGGHGEHDDGDNTDPISVMSLAAGRLWCAIRDKIFVVCPNSLTVEHSFVVDDCHRHVCSIATGGSSMHHVWIASQGSHEIRLYHATHFVCLLETSIRTIVTQKLQVCDDIIRAHKLGCLRVSYLHVCKETLWVGTSAGVLINISIPQLMDSTNNKLTANSLQLKGLSFGHAGPVRFILSTDATILPTSDETTSMKTFVFTIGDGFEDYTNNDESLGKDDALSHVIVWQL